jgi:hypothetical protein
MLYLETMKKTNWILTKPATDILGIHKYTLWRWGDSKRVTMRRSGPQKVREFDQEELIRLAPKLNKTHHKGEAVFPGKDLRRKKKAK